MQAQYFKVTNKKEKHHKFQYKDGLNVDTKPFDDNPNNSCCPGGLYFTTKEHIKQFLTWGCYVREVFLPTDDPNFKMVKDNDKWRANMIILGKRHDKNQWCMDNNIAIDYDSDYSVTPSSPQTISQSHYTKHNSSAYYPQNTNKVNNFPNLNSKTTYQQSFNLTLADFNKAAENGDLQTLRLFKNNKSVFQSIDDAIALAIQNRHTNVSKWLKDNKVDLCSNLKI